jgi:hypothetical protein
VTRSSKQNPRVLFPATGFTTNDLAAFYGRIAPVLLPYLTHRPVTLKRFPDDIHGESFWEKDVPAFTPKWVKTFSVPRVNEPTRYSLPQHCEFKDVGLGRTDRLYRGSKSAPEIRMFLESNVAVIYCEYPLTGCSPWSYSTLAKDGKTWKIAAFAFRRFYLVYLAS